MDESKKNGYKDNLTPSARHVLLNARNICADQNN